MGEKLFISILLSFLIPIPVSFSGPDIDVQSLNKLLKVRKGEVLILDVRTPFEWKESGVIDGALMKNAYDSDLTSYLKNLEKSKEIYIYCHSGSRSKKVSKLLDELGFKSFNLKGGIVSWQKNKLPLIEYKQTKLHTIKRVLNK